LAESAFRDVSHLLRSPHLSQLKKILEDPESSDNDRYVALEMLKNAVISAEMEFPMCQDTGTGIVMGKKGQQVWTGFSDEKALSKGIFNAYTKTNLRYSQNAPLNMYDEKNTGCNLPAQVEIYATEGDAYKFLFIAKGGGSANKTYLYQETKAVLNPGHAGGLPYGENENPWHCGMSTISPGIRHRRHICRIQPENGEIGFGRLFGSSADPGVRDRATAFGTWNWKKNC
jgi:hypothetical protein